MDNPHLLCNADVIFVSTNIFNNNNYKKCTEEDNFGLDEVYWHRIIFDEGHEVLHTNSYRKRVAAEILYEGILSLKATYKWVCSGTPLPHLDRSLDATLAYLTNDEFSVEHFYKLKQTDVDTIMKKYFRYNTHIL